MNGNKRLATKKKGNSKGKRRDKDYYADKEDRRSKSSNDPAWYAADKALLTDAASIPFSWAFGTKLDLGLPYSGNPGISDVVPGIMVERLVPCIGNTLTQENASNVAAFSAYSFIRHANSGHSNYESSDLMLYLIACAEIYSFIVFLQRTYGLAMTYAQKNRYIPKALMSASGVSYSDVVNHLADFRMRINVLINKMSSMAVPATMPYFNRLAFLYKNLYIDGTNIKNQLYMYAPAGFHVFTLGEDGVGYLQWRPWNSSTEYTIDQLIQMAEDMIQPIIEDEDMNIMSGDILKAYGSDKIITLASVPEMYNIIPLYDITVLEQMKNTTPVSSSRIIDLDITQDPTTSSVVFKPYIITGDDLYFNITAGDRILTTERDEVPPEAVIEATRLMVSSEVVGTTHYINCGTEICTGVTYYSINPITQEVISVTFGQTLEVTLSNSTTADTAIKYIPVVSNFKYHPALYLMVRATTSADYQFYGLELDIDNYAVLSAADIGKMHTAALLNMLNVPSVAKAYSGK